MRAKLKFVIFCRQLSRWILIGPSRAVFVLTGFSNDAQKKAQIANISLSRFVVSLHEPDPPNGIASGGDWAK